MLELFRNLPLHQTMCLVNNNCLLSNKPAGVVYSNEYTPSSIFSMMSSSWPSKIPAAQMPNVSLTWAVWSFMNDSKGEITSTVLVPIVCSFNTSAIIGKAWKIIDLPYPVCALKNKSLPLKKISKSFLLIVVKTRNLKKITSYVKTFRKLVFVKHALHMLRHVGIYIFTRVHNSVLNFMHKLFSAKPGKMRSKLFVIVAQSLT